MDSRWTRREFLATSATAGVVGLAGCSAVENLKVIDSGGSDADPVDIRGAMYIPSRAFNTYQMWRDYDPDVVERDLGYAAELNLNAIRTWLCYEFWEEDEEAHGEAVDHLLEAAGDRDIQVLLGIFEGVGKPPTEENLKNTDPLTATGVYSPSYDVVRNEDRWDDTREFVRWVMERYRDDERLLAIEVMNEPGWTIQQKFARGMFETMVEERGSVPLTVGSTSLANNTEYLEWGADILQFHYNFPSTTDVYHELLSQASDMAAATDKPIWLSEWQRVRSGRGFLSEVTGDEWQPNYASLAPTIAEYGVGNFFWSLMVKPAYVTAQREQGVISGLFHEDGAVWSIDDARALKAMSGDPSFDREERQEWPEWAMEVKEQYLDQE